MDDNQLPVEDESVAKHSFKKYKPPLWRRRWLRVGIGLLLIVAVSLLAYIAMNSQTPEDTTEQVDVSLPTQQQMIDDAAHDSELLYAYWEDDGVLVRSYDWTTKEKTDVIGFVQERFNTEDSYLPPVDYDPNESRLAYVEETAFVIYDRTSTEGFDFATRNDESDGRSGYRWSLGFNGVNLLNPEFSRNGQQVFARLNQFEGFTLLLFDLERMRMVPTSSLFSGGDTPNSSDFEIKPLTLDPFTSMGYLPSYYDDDGGQRHTLAGNFNSNSSASAFIVDETSLATADEAGMASVLGTGDYNGPVVFGSGDNTIYAARKSGSSFDIERWNFDNGKRTQILNVKQSFALPGTIRDVRLYSFDGVYAAVTIQKNNGDRAVIVVDVEKQDQLAEFLVDRESSFSILYAKR